MEKFRLNCQTTFLKWWLLALSCHSGYCLSEMYMPDSTSYSLSDTPLADPYATPYYSTEFPSNSEFYNQQLTYPDNFSFYENNRYLPLEPPSWPPQANGSEIHSPLFPPSYSYSEPGEGYLEPQPTEQALHFDFSQSTFYPTESYPCESPHWAGPYEHIESYFIPPQHREALSESHFEQARSSTTLIKRPVAASQENHTHQKASQTIADVVGKKDLTTPSIGAVDSFSAHPTLAEEMDEAIAHDPTIAQTDASSPTSTQTPEPSSANSTQTPEIQAPVSTEAPSVGELPVAAPMTPTTPPVETPVTPSLPPAPEAPPTTTIVTPSRTETLIQPQAAAPVPATTPVAAPVEETPVTPLPLKEISINFNNVAMVEYIRFISRISNKNFIFDEQDLQFNVTIVSEEPTSIENLMAALLQELKIRDLSLIEQGNNIIIHRNARVRAPGQIVAEGISSGPSKESEIITRVFRLNTLDPLKATEIIKPLLSDDALVELLRDTNNIIITDLVTNVNKIAQLINSLDAPNSGMVIGQYAVRNAFVDSLAALADKILQPIAQGNPYVIAPHTATNSIFIVSNPFIVERALAILENLDMNEGRTKILTLERLKLSEQEMAGRQAGPGGPGGPSGAPGVPIGPGGQPLPAGIGTEGANIIPPGVPFGGELVPGGIVTNPRWIQELPPGHIERTLFFIYKLKFRRGDQIELALRKIADSLILTGTANEDLIGAINSTQWLESSNSLIFTGTIIALDKVRELIEEIDVPLRQVFIEMLILDTTITDSLTYGVDWGSRFGGGNVAGAEAFLGVNAGPLTAGLDSASVPGIVNGIATAGPNPNVLARTEGFNLGVIGRHLTHNGLYFNSIAALVRAIHNDAKANIIMNPKIITEDNNTAEIFVGSTNRFKTQSISNDIGNVITNNFQFLDVGTTLRVTPLIGNNDIITLDIVEEITNDTGNANPITNAASVDVNLVPVLSKNRTLTRVHVPNGFFVVLSGMIQDTRSRTKSQIPCLGAIPILGGTSKQQLSQETKRNLMIFIRPLIIDTDDDIENITKRQQDVYREKTKFRRSWNYEIDQALDFFNIKPADPDEIGCTIK